MPQYVHDEAICLRVTDFSETSQIVAVFTRGHGVLPLIAKGAKRRTSRGRSGTGGGPLDLLTLGQLVFIPAKGTAELGTLSTWELVDPRNALRKSLAALNAGMMLIEITALLLHPHDPHSELFAELNAALALLATPQRPRAVVAYAKAALTAAGYQPQLEACLVCGAAPGRAPIDFRYAPVAGGLVCGNCPATGRVLEVDARIVIALDRLPAPRVLQANPPERAADPAALRQALELLLAHIEAITDKGVRTRAVLGEIFSS